MTARVALVGRPGAGKTSLAAALKATDGHWLQLSMARPLYAAQAALFDRMGVPHHELGQDGELLSFLGGHIRQRDPQALTRRVIERADWLQALSSERSVVISDARPVDLDELRDAGFTVVLVRAPEELRLARLQARDDLTENPDSAGVELKAQETIVDLYVDTAGSLADLEASAETLLRDLPAAPYPAQAGAVALKELGRTLYREASAAITGVYRPSRHQLGCAMLGDDGELATGVHVEAEVGRASTCAENGALAQTIARGAKPVAMMTVRHPRPEETRDVEIMPPCGLCRELLCGYGPDAMVWLPSGQVRLRDLLLHRYIGTKWRNHG
ncbi:hypothetical protein [Paenarthrobacter sp. TA1.8]|uniref:hypothetical protein n=1 Tax=Paenarthrobacter sp. TA1.8 TaxID=3400219 RepID=UPI003B43AB98